MDRLADEYIVEEVLVLDAGALVALGPGGDFADPGT